MTMEERLDRLEEEILLCGKWAVEQQSQLLVETKSDNSPVTQVDLGISGRVCSLITKLFPDCAIISEEETTEDKVDSPYTFVLDPIDGTDVFSQGLPSFAIALGILDKDLRPVGCMINAPRFGVATDKGMFLRLDPGKELKLNGVPAKVNGEKDYIKQITISSKNIKMLDFTDFKGKVRTFGSTILHNVAPVLYPWIQGVVNEPCYIWDYAAAHAVLLWAGMDLCRPDGTLLSYGDELIQKKRCSTMLIGGTPVVRQKLIETLKLK